MKAKNELQLQHLCLLISEQGYCTGSRLFGVATKESDYDYVMTINHAYKMFGFLGIEAFKEPAEEYCCCFISLKYKWAKGWVNLIIVPTEHDLEAWKYATENMLGMDKELIRDKKDRTKYFGWLLTEHYAYIPKGKHYKVALDMWGTGIVPRQGN